MTAHPEGSPSRRERPAKPALTRPGIVATALEVMRAEGLAKVTMRRLAQELDTGPASLYVYVSNTAELHAALLDELLGTVAPAPAAGDWRARLHAVLTSYVETLFAHPGLARSALTARPSGEHYLRLIETLLGLLDEGRVPRDRAAWGVDLLTQYATATAAEQATRDRSPEAEGDWDTLTRVVDGLSDRTHPHLAAAAPHLLSGAPRERLAWGFDALINGILHTPTPSAASAPTGDPA
ncbi:TetR/AcrR family transcriptional regulator [Streptomyces sp. NBC_01497]|uniref:TetR/AcrR family transcriptional regulator n=1 Tax=Streptomyces sp. NBC_01497 TaxID=2903885 RepID=UPI002E2FDDE7|nr:TetR/AcrR family transcriptional regulator [Streptomyces sp. NBC_01497]